MTLGWLPCVAVVTAPRQWLDIKGLLAMIAAAGGLLPPVLVLSTGRCGSTMISNIINRHPQVLSLSEFFFTLGPEALAQRELDGARMWNMLSRQSPATHALLKRGLVVSEMLYPLDAPNARFRAQDVPPLEMVALPHLTDDHEALFDELSGFVKSRARQSLAEQYNTIFSYLLSKFARRVWVERSGGSLMHVNKLLRLFPSARIIHVFRDGRDTALSMSQHLIFRVIVGAIKAARRYGIDPYKEFQSPRSGYLYTWLQRLLFSLVDVRSLTKGLTLADFGEFWSRLILQGLQAFGALPPGRVFNLRLEAMQHAPREELRKMIRFIDPSLEDDDWLSEVAAVPRPIRSRFGTLSAVEQRSLTAACAPGLAALGYPPAAIIPPAFPIAG